MTRPVDQGAVFAGWVGVGMAVMVAIGLELIVAVQSLVFIFAPIAGLLIGFYANARSARRRPWWRVAGNAAYAGLVTGLSLALLYGALRLLFIYADNGYPDFNRTDQQGQVVGAACTPGPDCSYRRYLLLGQAEQLGAFGVTNAASFERFVLQEQLNGALLLIAGTSLPAVAGGLIYGAGGRQGRDENAALEPDGVARSREAA